MRWITHKTYVHLETGELLTEKEAKLNYIIEKKIIKYGTEARQTERIGIRTITYLCRYNNQIRIEFKHR